jgi:hypothetical protein
MWLSLLSIALAIALAVALAVALAIAAGCCSGYGYWLTLLADAAG